MVCNTTNAIHQKIMKLKIFQVDAFADKVFQGNPAAVVPLDAWLDADALQNIAKENNLSETAFFLEKDGVFEIRWFTPTIEVDLCGHATLATAHVIFEELKYPKSQIEFYSSRSGILSVERANGGYVMNFPRDRVEEIDLTDELLSCFNPYPNQVFRGISDFVFVFDEEKHITDIQIDLNQISSLDARGIIITAAGTDVDFVSRFFGPKVGVPEDPVTGSAHTSLTPIWAEKLGKNKMRAFQASSRGGYLTCELYSDRVLLSGKAVTYLRGEIVI